MKELEEQLDRIYDRFFEDLNIDKTTGRFHDSKINKRFATKIAIGSHYPNSKKKILFVSFDMGKDELLVECQEDRFQNFDERREAVCSDNMNKNPHMAGVYGTALYFLKDTNGWEEKWNLLVAEDSHFKTAMLSLQHELPNDVLDYIALVNFYSFVTVGREGRSGDNDRCFIDEQKEIQLLIDTIKTISPDVIIVQSRSLQGYFTNLIKPMINPSTEIYVGVHPSILGSNIHLRKPKSYIEDLEKLN